MAGGVLRRSQRGQGLAAPPRPSPARAVVTEGGPPFHGLLGRALHSRFPGPRARRMLPPSPAIPRESRAMNVAQALLHGLKEYGAGEIFGIPGDFALPFFKVAEESRILPLHTLSHEPAVGFAADAAGRFRGTHRRGRGHLRRRRLQPGQRGLRCLRREVAGGGDLRRPRPGREPLGPAAAPSGPHARHAVPRLPGDHLRPGAAGRSRHRAGRDRARAHRRHRPGPAGLSRAAARHGGRALRSGPGLRARPRPTPTRSRPAPTRSWLGWPRPSGRWSWSTSRCAATGSRPRSPSSPKGWASRWSPPSWAAACSRPPAHPWPGPISASRATPPSPSWSRAPTVSCCWA